MALEGQVGIVGPPREPSEFHGELGHIPGAELVPLASLRGALASADRERELIVVCRSGGRSARAAAELVAMGFTRVRDLAGGMLRWNQERRAVER